MVEQVIFSKHGHSYCQLHLSADCPRPEINKRLLYCSDTIYNLLNSLLRPSNIRQKVTCFSKMFIK